MALPLIPRCATCCLPNNRHLLLPAAQLACKKGDCAYNQNWVSPLYVPPIQPHCTQQEGRRSPCFLDYPEVTAGEKDVLSPLPMLGLAGGTSVQRLNVQVGMEDLCV